MAEFHEINHTEIRYKKPYITLNFLGMPKHVFFLIFFFAGMCFARSQDIAIKFDQVTIANYTS